GLARSHAVDGAGCCVWRRISTPEHGRLRSTKHVDLCAIESTAVVQHEPADPGIWIPDPVRVTEAPVLQITDQSPLPDSLWITSDRRSTKLSDQNRRDALLLQVGPPVQPEVRQIVRESCVLKPGLSGLARPVVVR